MYKKFLASISLLLIFSAIAFSQQANNMINTRNTSFGLWMLTVVCILPLLIIIGKLYYDFRVLIKENTSSSKEDASLKFHQYLKGLDKKQIRQLLSLNARKVPVTKQNTKSEKLKSGTALFLLFLFAQSVFAQGTDTKPLMTQPGIIITVVLLLIPVLLVVIFAFVKVNNAIKNNTNSKKRQDAGQFALYLNNLPHPVLDEESVSESKMPDFNLTHHELAGHEKAIDTKGIISNISDKHEAHFIAIKRKATNRPVLDAGISKLILWYVGCAACWLVLGTGIGEYLGIKFVAPDVDHVSWLSFGRLRPVHTNIVFWGWASMAMIGLGYYVVPMVSNAKIYSLKFGWIALACINVMVIAGSISLMSGISNGGGEFREYTWPVMAFFAVALILTFINFFLTVARRTTKEIYISNWFILSAILFTIIVALTAYLPFWQNGIGETIVQGYFMHSGVGMWFTLYVVGLLYYFIPQQINKPIFAYSLGILAFWTQIIFYTIIGTHHFIFSAIPWWLQTVAIIGSAGMIIPVVAATINFTMTFKGHWNKVANSYTLPFFLVAVVYYFLVSMQGTVEAFKFTNLLWHFTDFTVAHAHAGFYGIITFALWGGMYAIIPRLTGKEPPQNMVGAHFWFAFIGLIFYVVPLSIGATYRGLMWMDSKPFIESVVLMFPYWVWRAIGGSLMFISHLPTGV